MKHKITDSLQVIAAILLTGGALVSAAPLPKELPFEEPVAVVETAQAKETHVDTPKALETAEKKPSEPKKENDPNHCEPEQYWAKDPPHQCIDKPKQVKSVSSAGTSSPTASVGGSCAEWISAAGIGDVANANELIRRESGCNPNAVNSSSGACGIAQELPCGKSGCGLGNGACQVRWMNQYVIARYGSWANAVAHHNANNWY